ncbi:hypothetical protein [Kineosporia succinea]|uniref:Uncharacterized protein n=1 Tax=Kineosporia succinea TaxID=84632 RepID=A0ABT9NZE1_9ACTN|nr:hypothetical protein [Kineosporia succinea]MDP9825801.1 hypothetical protein [Kineosporia succinea]
MDGQTWANILAVGGSLLGVVVGGALASRAQQRHWRFAEQADACSEFLAAYSGVYLAHVAAVRSGRTETASSSSGFIDWHEFDQATENLNLRVDAEVVQAAHDLDKALWEVAPQIVGRPVTLEQWNALRRPLDAAKLRFVNVCRTRIGRRSVPLTSLNGRPADDDPHWDEHRSGCPVPSPAPPADHAAGSR